MWDHPVEFTPDDNDTLLVTFPDIPEAVTFGADEAEARTTAVDALETALTAYILDRRDIPVPSPSRRRPSVSPTLLGALKLSVYKAMRDDLAASGDKALQPENLKASPMRSWIGLYATLKMIRDAKMTSFQSDQAIVNTRTGVVEGPAAISGQTAIGTVRSNQFEVHDKGDRVIYKGGVHARLNNH